MGWLTAEATSSIEHWQNSSSSKEKPDKQADFPNGLQHRIAKIPCISLLMIICFSINIGITYQAYVHKFRNFGNACSLAAINTDFINTTEYEKLLLTYDTNFKGQRASLNDILCYSKKTHRQLT